MLLFVNLKTGREMCLNEKRAEKEAERCSKLVHSKAMQPSSNLLSETTFLDPFAAGTLAYYFLFTPNAQSLPNFGCRSGLWVVAYQYSTDISFSGRKLTKDV